MNAEITPMNEMLIEHVAVTLSAKPDLESKLNDPSMKIKAFVNSLRQLGSFFRIFLESCKSSFQGL
jgi:hypothetical protein